MKQIARKKYYEKFLTKGKPICLVGASFIGKEINTVSLKLEL
ncbi:MAG: hypothetical protein IPN18_04155 [Ignavibacteriales bacterium]|nr:hypothetical protein [Ignavibacteriales bacterium]